MEKLKMHSPDLTAEKIRQIAELLPNCVTESKGEDGAVRQAIDFDQLRQELSEHTVEGPTERYRLDWPGKREAILTANAPIAKTLRPCRAESVDFDTTKNLFIEGDNLDALKLLQETYLGKVKLIYIDPPYNTGNDFIYRDDFVENSDTYLRKSNQQDEEGSRLVANSSAHGRYHSAWLTMMYPRLKLARSLLTEHGVCFISIDDNEVASLQLVCDEVFGNVNFLGQISVVSNLKGRSDDKFFATAHNYLLAYSRGGFSSLGVPMPDDYYDDYPETAADGRRFRLQGLRKRGTGARREDRPKMYYPFYVNATDASLALERRNIDELEVYPRLSDGADGRWRWGKETAKARLDELGARKVGSEGRWDVFQIDFVESNGEGKRIRPKSIWTGPEFANETGTLEVKSLLGRGAFDNPKPTGLIKYLLEQTVENDGDICLDFFAGSGTSAHAVQEFNLDRGLSVRFISIQLPESVKGASKAASQFTNVAEITKARIRASAKRVAADAGLDFAKTDLGFRVLKIDTSNMQDVYYTPNETSQASLLSHVNNIKADRTPEDLLFQVLLDWGVDLASPIESETIGGKQVFFVDGNALAACFDFGLTDEFVKQIADRKPLRAVFRDASYASDAAKINVEQIFKFYSPETEVRCL